MEKGRKERAGGGETIRATEAENRENKWGGNPKWNIEEKIIVFVM